MNKDYFAQTFGYENYDNMLENTTIVFKDDPICWNITKLPDDRFIAWDDAEIADDRVEIFSTREEAKNYLGMLRKKFAH